MILCLFILFPTFFYYVPNVNAAEKSVYTVYNGNRISELEIHQNEKKVLSADTVGFEGKVYQWQILPDTLNSVWVNIYDKTERDCEISYAVLMNLLDEANSAYIRCFVSDGSEDVYSEAVCITVIPAFELSEQTESFESALHSSVYAVPTADESDFVTVTIKYLDMSSLSGPESAIYSPYTATIAKGSDFNQSIVSPTFLGFAPYYSKNGGSDIDNDASTISLDLKNVTENVVINVYYKPIEVNFAVRYFFQNIDNDLYTENTSLYHIGKATTGTIIEDSYLQEHAKNTKGFQKIYHVPETVAADGSTVFECYYDRAYFLIQFDLDGGYGTDPIYARYGTPYIVNEPTKNGYSFSGWDLLDKDTNGDGIPDQGDGKADDLGSEVGGDYKDVTYKAIWTSSDTTYTAAYWAVKDNGEREYLGKIRTDAKSGDIVSAEDNIKEKYKQIFAFDEHEHSYDAGCYGNCTSSTPWRHNHTDECLSCTKLAHKHTDDCNPNPRYYEYDSELSDKNIVIEGDGSSTVNFYYRPKKYTLRFFYARESDSNGYEVVGGSTYAFGGYDLNENSSNPGSNYLVQDLLSRVPAGNWGQAEKPQEIFYSNTALSGSTSDTSQYTVHDGIQYPGLPVGDYTYYYFEFTARYGDDISTKWPIGILSPVKMDYKNSDTSTHTSTVYKSDNETLSDFQNRFEDRFGKKVTLIYKSYWDSTNRKTIYYATQYELNGETYTIAHTYSYLDNDGKTHNLLISQKDDYKYAYFSAWNGEYKVKYTQDHKSGNQTIKGRYMVLDENLLHDHAFDNDFENSTELNFLGFWDNGANQEWSVPKLFQYHLMLEVPSTTVIDAAAGTVTENGVVLDKEKVRIITQDSELVLNIPEGTRIFRLHNGIWYEQYQTFRTFDDSTYEAQTATFINGFTFKERTWSRRDGGYTSIMGEKLSDAYDVFFYYERNDYTLTYFNYENVITSRVVEYNTALTKEPYDERFDRYPPSLEPGAYEFVGWYTSPMRIYPIDFETAKMPAENIVWYAKWVPVKHNVNFFITYDDMLAYESDSTSVTPLHSYTDIEHRTIVGSVDSPKRTGDGGIELIFSGWFYMENGEKKAFSPLSMPISSDMNIFADWSSSSPQPYRIQYVLENDHSVKVAEDTTGFAYAGSTRTFTAKAGNPYNQLFDEYNKGYFPTVSSHSITVQYEEDKKEPKLNTSTFYYVYAQEIEYTVRYVNKTNNTVMEEVKKKTSDAVITERFKAYPNMVPDAFYKRLVLSVEYDEETKQYVSSKNNVITFYYTPNNTSAFYAVHFMLEKFGATDEERKDFAIDGSGGYEENGTYFEGTGNIGEDVSVVPQKFPGFSLIPNQAIAVTDEQQSKVAYTNNQYSIKVTQTGTELYIFYKREAYEYQVHYYLYNTTQPVSDEFPSKSKKAPYGSQITEGAANIPGYSCVSAKSQTISIRDNPNQNEIIFYYEPIQSVAEYVAVPSDGGSLSSTIEVISGNGEFKGSVPSANEYYRFVGWYLDEACTQGADSRGTVDPDNFRFTPDKDMISTYEHNIFYAKFVRSTGDLTIIRNNAEDPTQVFVYEVKNDMTSEVITVSVVGNSSVTISDLPFGSYTVTQKNEWSWRHDDIAISISHQSEGGTTVPFSGAQKNDSWLNGNSAPVINQRGKEQ